MEPVYTSCLISDQPIEKGDSVVALFLIKSPRENQAYFNYTNDLYDFATFPIYGKFSAQGEIILDNASRNLVKAERLLSYMNIYRTDDKDLFFQTFMDLEQWVLNNCPDEVFKKSKGSSLDNLIIKSIPKLSMAICHQDVFEDLLHLEKSKIKNQKYSPDFKKSEKAIHDFFELLPDLIKPFTDKSEISKEILLNFVIAIFHGGQEIPPEIKKTMKLTQSQFKLINQFSMALNERETSIMDENKKVSYLEPIVEDLQNGSIQNFKNYVEELLDLKSFYNGMNNINKMLLPHMPSNDCLSIQQVNQWQQSMLKLSQDAAVKSFHGISEPKKAQAILRKSKIFFENLILSQVTNPHKYGIKKL